MTTASDRGASRLQSKLVEAAETIDRLRGRLRELERRDRSEPIAVIGAALRMPGGAQTPEQFWSLLHGGTDTTTEFPASRGDARALFNPDPEHPGTAYVIRGGFLGDIDGFDPAVFGISPREAVGMDPQQRITLELGWEAVERAGYAPSELTGSRTGVYVGVSTTDYVRLRQQLGDPQDVDAYQLVGEPSFIAGRLSYTLGLRGPSMVIDTTCSSSLVAVHQACQGLRAGECDMALAGGISLMLSPYGFLLMSKFRALAPDGRCKTFDATADGYARGEGGGLVALKRLSDAVAAGDTILAVLRGSAVNHDGRSSGLTVPSPEAQQDVIRRALAQAGVRPGEVTYVEAHGTGTSLGDPIEFRALAEVLADGRDPSEPLLVGSVKTNIGHLEPAAGIAGLLKVVLAMQHSEIPPHLHLVTPNPKIPWDRLPIRVATEATPWPERDPARVAAVSSFGASGTNAHLVLSGPPSGPGDQEGDREDRDRDGSGRSHLLVLSARTTTALRELAARYADYLPTSGQPIGEICFTSQVGRNRQAHGLGVIGQTTDDMTGQLTDFARTGRAPRVITAALAPHRDRRVAWLLTGQGSQYQGMAAGLRREQAFAVPFQECADLLDPLLPRPLAAVIWADSDDHAIDNTAYTQPALFAVEYALGRALLAWGIRPAVLLGHSIGEITAACLAGAIDLPDAARLVAGRAALMAALPAGGLMAAVSCDEATATKAIAGHTARVAIAAVNGPADVVLSGSKAEVEEVAAELARAGCRTHLLKVSHAFHSPLLRPMLDDFTRLLDSIRVRDPDIPLISNVTGEMWGPAQLDSRYWVRHAAGTVRFHDGIRLLHDQGIRTFLEVGPQPVLTGLARKSVSDPSCAWITSLRRGAGDEAHLLRALGTLHLRGSSVEWRTVHGGRTRRAGGGPTYPWERDRFWFRQPDTTLASSGPVTDGLGHRIRGPEPAFEEHLSDRQALAAAGDALAWVVERSARAAWAGPGGRWPRLAGATVDASVPAEITGPWVVHTAVGLRPDECAEVEISGAHPDTIRSGASWLPHGRAVLCRSAGPWRPPSSAAAGESSSWPVSRSGPPGPAADAEAAAWGAVVRAAAAAVAAVAGEGGWVHALDGAVCGDPEQVRSVRIAHSAQADAGLRADVTLHAGDGNMVGEITGLLWTPGPASLPSRWHADSDLVYQVEWVPVPSQSGSLAASAEHVLILGEGDLAGELASKIRQRGAACDVAALATAGVPDPGMWLTDGLTRVVISALTLPTPGELTAEALRTRLLPVEQSVIRLLQEINARSWRGAPPRIVLLTRGAVPAGAVQRTHNPAGATLWGLGRVIALEHPESWAAAVDLDPDGPADIEAVATAVLDPGGEDQSALRGPRRLAPRLRPVDPGTLPAPAAHRPGRPGTVLITGGWGGIGGAVAEWLARAGVSRLVLAGRSGLPDEGEWDDPALAPEVRARIATLRRLRAIGSDVEAVSLDVTSEADVTALVTRLASGPHPLRGVVHGAGVSAPQDLAEVDEDTYESVWAPKTIGTWLLHQATSGLDLDFFVCLSSIAATWGSQHLASYSAANMFLDGLAHYRRAAGLPCLTVDWGPWDVRSRLFGDEVMSFLESVGLRRLHPAQCLSLLGRLLRAPGPQYVVCAVDWARYKPVMEARADQRLLRGIEIHDADQAGEEDTDLLRRLTAHTGGGAAARSARQDLLSVFLRSAIARVLGTETESIAADADIFAIGLDSLMVMEVVAKCRRSLRAVVRPSDFFARSSLAQWSAHLDQVMLGGQDAQPDESDGMAAETGTALTGPQLSPALIAAHATLPGDVHTADRPVGAGPDAVLLTGATGFVGAYLLDELLTSTTAEVHCLVRCSDQEEGMARIRSAMQHYLPWPAGADGRVRAVAGDLARPRLGLADAAYAFIAERVGAIYHAGAQVDFVHTFEQLAPANITGTEEVLRLAGRGRAKQVNHVSTYGIWGLPVQGRSRIMEAADISTAGHLVTGYVQTKWAAEHLLAQARARGMPTRTFRLGRVLGDSRSGVCLTTHFTCRVIKGCIQLGLAPDLDDLEIEMTPVDYVARSLVHIARSDTTDEIFHLVNPVRMRFRELVAVIRRQGWDVRLVDRQQWWRALQQSLQHSRNELHPVMDIVREFVVGGEEAIDYDTSCTEKALAGSGIRCPPLDSRLLDTYFGYFTRSGYLTR